MDILEKDIFSINSQEGFEQVALKVFRFQYEQVPVYREFCNYLKVESTSISNVEDIPFLPITFFKSHQIIAKGFSSEKIFSSSGTTGSITSKHYISNLELYERSFSEAFQKNYGSPKKYAILALLPSYLERQGSSLIYMVDQLISKSNNEHSAFYLDNYEQLIEKMLLLESDQQPTILLGVTYALLDLIDQQQFKLNNTIVMETGGMKGRRKELIREDLHAKLSEGFGVTKIHSEYGMTELLSQGYSNGDGIFTCPPWMKVLTRDTEDALTLTIGKTGGINVIDLANINSCSFIATQDLGKVYSNGSFEILGRFDTSDIRGCNLMVL